MPFKKGHVANPNGRPIGAINQKHKTVKETVLQVFEELQKDPKHNLKKFAKDYPRDFYQIAAKLIPTDIKASIYGEIEIKQKPSWFETTHQLLPEQRVQETNHN